MDWRTEIEAIVAIAEDLNRIGGLSVYQLADGDLAKVNRLRQLATYPTEDLEWLLHIDAEADRAHEAGQTSITIDL